MSGTPENKGSSDQAGAPSNTASGNQANPNPNRGPSPPRASRSTSAIPQLSRSRKNSQEFSPTRNNALSSNLSTIPSAAAVQRALSAQRPFNPPSSVDGVLDGARQDRQFRSGQNSPAWPTSPRLKSPPPSAGSKGGNLPRKPENDQTPNTSLKRMANQSNGEGASVAKASDPNSQQQTSSIRVPTRVAPTSTLETVAESSVPSTPSVGQVADPISDSKTRGSSRDTADPSSETSTIKDGGEASGDGEIKPHPTARDNSKRARAPSASKPTAIMAKRSYTSLTPKPKPPDPPRTMTVETEPVTSMPQLLGDRGGRDGSGSVRTKASSETIKPKKEKKKTARKPTTLHSGPGKIPQARL